MKAHALIGKLISSIKSEDYKIDYEFSLRDLARIFWTKFASIARGMTRVKPFLAKSQGLVFAERGARVLYGHKVRCGKNLNLMEHATINALSYDGVTIGDNCSVGRYAMIECTGVLRAVGQKITIGDNVGINHYCYIGVRGEIKIGDNVIFGPRVSVFSENHNFDKLDVPIKHQGVTRAKTTIGSDCWIGANAVIVSGVTIGQGCVIGAGSVVTKDVEPYSVIAGVPAKLIRKRNG